MGDDIRHQQTEELHQRATRALAQPPEEYRKTPASDIQQLIHDLSVHEIEIEMENAELRQTQIDLDVLHKKFVDLFDFAPVGYLNIDSKGVILQANITASDLLGIPRSKLANKHLTAFVEPQHQVTFKAYIKELNETGSRLITELEMHKRGGGRFYVQLTAIPIYENSKLTYRVSLTDISKLKRTEKALQESETRFRNMFETSPIGIEVYDSAGGLLEANKACLNIFGVTDVESVKGFKLFEDPNLTEDIKEKLLKGEAVRWEMPFDFGLVHKYHLYSTSSSGMIYLDVQVNPLIYSNNATLGYLVQLQDITERKRMEDGLTKRARELHSLYSISKILAKPDQTTDDVVEEIIDLLPAAWHYSEITAIRIVIDNKTYQTANYTETPWRMTSDILDKGNKVGYIEVVYLEEKPAVDEGPFLKEERFLIDLVADQLRRIVKS